MKILLVQVLFDAKFRRDPEFDVSLHECMNINHP